MFSLYEYERVYTCVSVHACLYTYLIKTIDNLHGLQLVSKRIILGRCLITVPAQSATEPNHPLTWLRAKAWSERKVCMPVFVLKGLIVYMHLSVHVITVNALKHAFINEYLC
jgi:hypothetical protein